MSTVLGIALCALIGVVALVFGLGTLEIRLEIRVTDLESKTKLLNSLTKYFEKRNQTH